MADFSWAAAADVGSGLIGGLSRGLTALGNAEVAKSNAKAANLVREGQNEVRRSAAGLAATIRSINDDRILNAANERRDALVTNAVRTQDAFTRRDFETSVRGAEAHGRISAQVAASGLGGAGITAISKTVDLQLARAKEAAQSQEQSVAYDQGRQVEGVIPSALQALSTSPIILGYDRSVNAVPQSPNIAGALIAGLLDKRASLQTMLGSLKDNTATDPIGQPKASFAFDATTYPVADRNVTGTPLVGPYEDTERFYNRQPPPYANSIDALNVRTN